MQVLAHTLHMPLRPGPRRVGIGIARSSSPTIAAIATNGGTKHVQRRLESRHVGTTTTHILTLGRIERHAAKASETRAIGLTERDATTGGRRKRPSRPDSQHSGQLCGVLRNNCPEWPYHSLEH